VEGQLGLSRQRLYGAYAYASFEPEQQIQSKLVIEVRLPGLLQSSMTQ
jgi:hypothetical protein